MLDWVDWRIVLIVTLIALGLVALGSTVWKRLGNAGDPAHCCVCGAKATKYVPIVRGSMLDALLARSRRINGIPWSYRVGHDFDDPRRLCLSDYRPRVTRLETWMDGARAELATFNRTQRASIPVDAFDDVKAPEPETRKPVDSAIELEPIGEA
jgi:hypothetical protein